VNVDKETAWMAYGRRLYNTGIAVLAEADSITVGAKVRDPKVLAMALLARTIKLQRRPPYGRRRHDS